MLRISSVWIRASLRKLLRLSSWEFSSLLTLFSSSMCSCTRTRNLLFVSTSLSHRTLISSSRVETVSSLESMNSLSSSSCPWYSYSNYTITLPRNIAQHNSTQHTYLFNLLPIALRSLLSILADLLKRLCQTLLHFINGLHALQLERGPQTVFLAALLLKALCVVSGRVLTVATEFFEFVESSLVMLSIKCEL